jgi:hypothetical protein
MKWNDRRNVTMISTFLTDETREVTTQSEQEKVKIVATTLWGCRLEGPAPPELSHREKENIN